MPTASILIRDGSTNLPLAGALVFVGYLPAVTTGSDGRAQVTIDLGSYNVFAQISGYAPANLPVVLTSNEGFLPDTLSLQPNTNPARILNIHVLGDAGNSQQSAIYGAQVIITGGPTGTETLYAGQDGTVLTQQKYTNGPYTISVSLTGWESISSASLTVVDGTNDYTFVLAKTSDPGTGVQGASVVDTGSVSSSQLQPGVTTPNVPVPDYEFIYPSNEFGKYFTTTQARMYIGNMFIDEFNSCRLVLQDNQIPIYGYASRDFDAVGRGRGLVQGQLDLNFISEGYLYTILNEFNKLMTFQAQSPAQDQKQQFEKLRQSRIAVANKSTATADGNPAGTTDLAQVANQLSFLDVQMDTLAAQGPGVLDLTPKNPNPSNPVGPTYPNACYSRVAFDLVLVLEGAGRKVTRRLEKCYLTGNEQIFDQSGAPVMDSYSFIARRLR
jgi:hypothetical protein